MDMETEKEEGFRGSATVETGADDQGKRGENINTTELDHIPKAGLTIVTTSVFLVGEMAGSGVLALPKAIIDTGWIGLVLILMCCLGSGYCGISIGKCWVILQERFPEYRKHSRDPYPSIAFEAVGMWGRYAVSLAINITLFGVGTVFLLLSAENIQSLIKAAGHHFSFCYWLLIIWAVLTPLTWLGTPKDFWPIAVGASLATAVACILLLINMLMDHAKNMNIVTHSNPTITSFFLAFGTILFSFGGIATFPTIQMDMKQPRNFSKAVLVAYSSILLMYVPIAAAGFFVIGDGVNDNILKSVSDGPLLYTVTVLITVHLMMGMIIALNPLFQDVEGFCTRRICNIPLKFSIKRCILRTIVMACILFVCETIPHFGAILSLIGGSTITFLTFICPPLFRLRLSGMKGDWEEKALSLHEKVLCFEIMVIGLIGGGVSTYSAISHMANAFVPPCYVNMTAAEK